MSGWIKLHRSITDNPIWKKRPYSFGHAWASLLLKASHKRTQFLHGNQLIECDRGQFITSELKLMTEWGWSKSKVRAFLKLIQDLKMIDKKTDQKKTTITISNYSTYQDTETSERPKKNHGETTKEPLKDTIKNIKKVKNEKKVFIKPTLVEVTAFCLERKNGVNPERWLAYYESNGWKVGRNPMKDWKAAVRTWEANNFGSAKTEQEQLF